MNEQISLYFTQGSSDKEYHAQLSEKDGGFVVTFQYGRRGAALQSGTKTATPLPYANAKKTYDKLVAEKTGKGYSPAESGAAYQNTEFETVNTGNIPQLLNPITEAEANLLLLDDGWGLQEKMDGERRMIEVQSLGTRGSNRKGLQVALPLSVSDKIVLSPKDTLFDGEMIGDTFYAFDCCMSGGGGLQPLGYAERYSYLRDLVSDIGSSYVILVPLVTGTAAKRKLYDQVRARSGEGVVFKKLDAPYNPGRPSSGGDQLKYKFTEMATCRVSGVHPSKRSVSLELMDGSLIWRNVGNVAIPPNAAIPREGDLVEIQYLYAYPGGSLFQPVYLRPRLDQDTTACVTAQLKFKPEGRQDEEDEVAG